ncbi:MAG: carbamate kinase [Clostridia bacterium]|nr:carbamate kinase [Clostridia bacterium]
MMKVVIALGGNALGDTPQRQKEIVKKTAKYIVPIIKSGYDVILTHGNGPQVGLINLAFEEGKKNNQKVYEMPFSECGAMSQGYIGYHLQNALQNELKAQNIDKKVISVITQVEVDKDDIAFKNPTKPIGSFYSKEDAEKMSYPMKEDAGRGYRRVIASPKPVKILEEPTIKNLVDNNFIVISCGGGGIPVINQNGVYQGVDAVIDKDFASSKLADEINSEYLLILTAIDSVCINYNTPNQQKLEKVSVETLKEYNNQGHFHAGSMKPKVEASIDFVEKGENRTAIITSIEKAHEALKGLAGTRITK